MVPVLEKDNAISRFYKKRFTKADEPGTPEVLDHN